MLASQLLQTGGAAWPHMDQPHNPRKLPPDSAWDPIGLSGIGFSALLALIALAVWLIWLQVF